MNETHSDPTIYGKISFTFNYPDPVLFENEFFQITAYPSLNPSGTIEYQVLVKICDEKIKFCYEVNLAYTAKNGKKKNVISQNSEPFSLHDVGTVPQCTLEIQIKESQTLKHNMLQLINQLKEIGWNFNLQPNHASGIAVDHNAAFDGQPVILPFLKRNASEHFLKDKKPKNIERYEAEFPAALAASSHKQEGDWRWEEARVVKGKYGAISICTGKYSPNNSLHLKISVTNLFPEKLVAVYLENQEKPAFFVCLIKEDSTNMTGQINLTDLCFLGLLKLELEKNFKITLAPFPKQKIKKNLLEILGKSWKSSPQTKICDDVFTEYHASVGKN